MGLRLNEGVDLGRLPDAAVQKLGHKIKELTDSGFIVRSGGLLTATSAGRPVLNGVLRHLLDD